MVKIPAFSLWKLFFIFLFLWVYTLACLTVIPNFLENSPTTKTSMKGESLGARQVKTEPATASSTPITVDEQIASEKSSGQSNSSGSQNNVLVSIPYWDQQAGFASFQKNVGKFDYLALFWYVLRSDGSVQKYPYAVEDLNIVKFAHANNVKVLALVANLPAEDEAGNWDYKRVDKVISSKEARARHIADLVNLVNSKGFDGLNLDYEALRAGQKNNFTLFVKELSEELHKNGKILNVALHPKVTEEDPEYSNGSEAQDWKELGKYADQFYLMTFDEHWDSSEPGPIASPAWVEQVLNYAKSQIPAEKIFAGVALFGYDWVGSEGEGLTFRQVQALINKYKPQVIFDNNQKSYYFTYNSDGANHTVWYEENLSIKAKLEMFNRIGIKNLAFWRLGGEDPSVWSHIQ